MYNSEKVFRIWSYTVSHSTLFVRNNEWTEDEQNNKVRNSTIDLEFWDVSFIELPDRVDGLILRILPDEFPHKLLPFCIDDRKVFEIESNEVKYYVVAHGCVIGKSDWAHDKGRFENFSLEYQEILFKS